MALTKKTGNEKPRPQIGKTSDKTRLVRFVDLNRTIEELNTELATKDSEITLLEDSLVVLQNQVLAIPGADATTAIVNISSAQILAMGTTPIELLPVAGVGMYYDVDRVILEYSHNTLNYALSDIIAVYGISATYGTIYDTLLIESQNMVYKFSPNGASDNTGAGYAEELNANIVLSTVGSTDPTGGDGTMRAIITYTVRTFGA